MARMTFITHDNQKHIVDMQDGISIMEASKPFPFALEGACGGQMGCATCHVIIGQQWYDKLPAPSEQEEAMLDVAFGITETSRLGCQVRVDPLLEGMVVRLPEALNFDAAVVANASQADD